MKIKFKFFINFLVIFFINSFLLFGQQMDNTMISIYNQITNEEQHQAMLNLQLSDETISDIYTLCSNADWIEETSNAFIVGGCQIYYKSNHGVMHKLGTKLGMDIPLPFLNIPPPPITNEDGSVIQFSTFYQRHAYRWPYHSGSDKYWCIFGFDGIPQDHQTRIWQIMSEWETGTKIDFLATHPDATGFELVLRIKRDDLGYVSGSVTTSTTTTTSGGIIQNVTYNSMILRYNENLTLGDYPGLNTTITTNGTLITNGCILRYEPGVGFAIEPKIEYDPETITVHTNVTSTSYFNTTFRHEFGHAIGFPHEHQKWNRDNYLDFINTSDANSDQYAIIPQYQTWTTSSTSEVQTSSLGCGFLWLFPCYETVTTTTQHESGSGINLINGFDYESIMIYDNRFYYDGSTEIIRRPGYISPLDKDAVNIFYP